MTRPSIKPGRALLPAVLAVGITAGCSGVGGVQPRVLLGSPISYTSVDSKLQAFAAGLSVGQQAGLRTLGRAWYDLLTYASQGRSGSGFSGSVGSSISSPAFGVLALPTSTSASTGWVGALVPGLDGFLATPMRHLLGTEVSGDYKITYDDTSREITGFLARDLELKLAYKNNGNNRHEEITLAKSPLDQSTGSLSVDVTGSWTPYSSPPRYTVGGTDYPTSVESFGVKLQFAPRGEGAQSAAVAIVGDQPEAAQVTLGYFAPQRFPTHMRLTGTAPGINLDSEFKVRLLPGQTAVHATGTVDVQTDRGIEKFTFEVIADQATGQAIGNLVNVGGKVKLVYDTSKPMDSRQLIVNTDDSSPVGTWSWTPDRYESGLSVQMTSNGGSRIPWELYPALGNSARSWGALPQTSATSSTSTGTTSTGGAAGNDRFGSSGGQPVGVGGSSAPTRFP